MTPDTLYSQAVATLKPTVNHKRIPDSDRRFIVTVNGKTVYTDVLNRVARLTDNGRIGTVIDTHSQR